MASAPPRPNIPQLADLPLVIDTPRLQLRPLQLSDADDLHEHAADPRVSKYLSWSAHTSKADTIDWLTRNVEAQSQGTDVQWAIVHDGRAIGSMGLNGIRWTFRAWRIDRAELGYWIGVPSWGQGLMSEAALAATRWSFETLGLHKITIGCVDGNLASQKIIEKIGYRFLCKMEDDFWRGGQWWDHRRYELTAAEWADSSRTLRFNKPRLP